MQAHLLHCRRLQTLCNMATHGTIHSVHTCSGGARPLRSPVVNPLKIMLKLVDTWTSACQRSWSAKP